MCLYVPHCLLAFVRAFRKASQDLLRRQWGNYATTHTKAICWYISIWFASWHLPFCRYAFLRNLPHTLPSKLPHEPRIRLQNTREAAGTHKKHVGRTYMQICGQIWEPWQNRNKSGRAHSHRGCQQGLRRHALLHTPMCVVPYDSIVSHDMFLYTCMHRHICLPTWLAWFKHILQKATYPGHIFKSKHNCSEFLGEMSACWIRTWGQQRRSRLPEPRWIKKFWTNVALIRSPVVDQTQIGRCRCLLSDGRRLNGFYLSRGFSEVRCVDLRFHILLLYSYKFADCLSLSRNRYYCEWSPSSSIQNASETTVCTLSDSLTCSLRNWSELRRAYPLARSFVFRRHLYWHVLSAFQSTWLLPFLLMCSNTCPFTYWQLQQSTTIHTD